MSWAGTLQPGFDALMDKANEAAIALDAPGLEAASQEIDSWMHHLSEIRDNEEALTYVRAGMAKFNDLCRFVSDTLHDALTAGAEQDGSGRALNAYGSSGKKVRNNAKPLLMKQYG